MKIAKSSIAFASLLAISLLCATNEADAKVGATVPFTSVEAETGLLAGGASIVYLTNPPTSEYSSPVLEASGHSYVTLTAIGQSVTITNTTGSNVTALNLRSCIPDAPAGGGISNTIDLYVNGVFRQAFGVNSEQNYCYEGTDYDGQTDKNPADGDPRDFWNDTHAFISGAAVTNGGTITFQMDASNTATFYYIDVVDLENPPPALGQPTGSLSITSYGASTNNADNTSDINSCFSAAKSQGKVAWIPPGTWNISAYSGGLNASGITIAGAGPWYSTIYRVTPVNGTQGVANIITTSSCTISNLALDCNSASRNGNNNNGAVNSSGNNWVVNNVWIQHVTSAFWCAGTGGIAENCRVLATWADGGNFNNVQSPNGIGNNLTYSNQFVRSTGDDAMAINSVFDNTGSSTNYYTVMSNITYVNNTAIEAWGGKEMGIYGGINVRVANNLLCDSARYLGLGVGKFGVNGSDMLSAVVTNNTLLRCGGDGYTQQQQGMMIGNGGDGQSVGTVEAAYIAYNTISNALYDGVGLSTSSNIVFEHNTIIHPGLDGIQIGPSDLGSGVTGSTIFNYNTVSNINGGSSAYVNSAGNYWAGGISNTGFTVPGSIPAPWVGLDVGSVAVAGGASYSQSTNFWNVGSGAGIGGVADAFHFTYQPATGNCTITARVLTEEIANPLAQAGVMIRNSLNPGDLEVSVLVTPTNGIVFASRSTNGGATTTVSNTGPLNYQTIKYGGNTTTTSTATNFSLLLPYWVSVTRSGNTFSGSYSSNGVTWTTIGTPTTLAMGTNVFAGLPISSGSNGALSSALVTSAAVSVPPTLFPAVHWEGDLIANLQSADLNAGGSVWTNRTSSANGVGNFSTTGGNLNVATMTWNAQSVNALFVNDTIGNALQSALQVPAEIISNNPVSAEAWIYATAVGQQNSCAISYGIQGGSSDPEADREFNYNIQISGGVSGDFGTYDTGWKTTPAAGAWHYLAWTYNGATVNLYLDGALNASNTPGSALQTPATVMGIGAGFNISSNLAVDQFEGYIAAARVESGVLTAADIATNYALGLLATAAAVTPSGLTATAGDSQVVLSWNVSSNATGYNVKNSTASAGPYTTVATNLGTLSFTNTGLTDGTTYYFVVSALNAAGESSNSAPVSAQPVAVVPVFTQQPTGLSLYPGQTAQFAAAASGAAAYQWQLTNATYPGGTALVDGGIISGSASNVLTLSGVASSNAGTYVLVATGPTGGVAISSNATLAILATGSAMRITTSALDTAGQDWNTGSIWNPAGPAATTAYEYPGSTYEVLSGGVLNTPNVNASTAFPGVDLQIDSGGELLLEHLSSISLAFPDLQLLNGGSMVDGADGTLTLTGELDIAPNASGSVTISSAVNAPTLTWVVNFDVPGGIGGVNYSGQGAYPDSVNNPYWNPIAPDGTTSAGTLWSDGATVSPITFTEQQTSTGSDNPGSPGTPQGLEYLYANAGTALSTSVETCTLHNVPAGNYNLYLYGKDDDNDDADRGTTFSVNVGATSYGSLSTTNYYDTGFILYNDYVVFSNVFMPTAGTITFTYTANPNANSNHDPNDEGNFNGLQLLTVVPAAPGPRSIQIASLLTGGGTINYSGSTNAANDLNITGTGNTYSGQWNVAQGGLLGSGSNSLGTNNITIGANAALETTYNINNPNGSLTLNGQMYLYTADAFNAVTVNGVNLVPGTYTSAHLNTSYPTNFPTTWPVQMGSTTGTNTGLGGQITVLPTLTPPLFNFAVSGGQIQLSWPQANTGWSLQVQTNPPGMGITTNWVTVPVSTLTNLMTFPLDSVDGSIFYQLVYP